MGTSQFWCSALQQIYLVTGLESLSQSPYTVLMNTIYISVQSLLFPQ